MSRFLTELSVTPLADGVQWRVNDDFRYDSTLLLVRRESGVIVVPKGFVTDFASIPQALWPEFPPWQRYGAAAVVHDWLYWSQDTMREVADGVLREAMQALAVDNSTVGKIYAAVRLFGQASWDHNAVLKHNGYNRMASIASNPPYAEIAI